MGIKEIRPLAVVTGGSRGIGRAIVLEMALCGFDIAVIYQSAEAAAMETAVKAEKLGAKVQTFALDVTNGGQCRDAINKITAAGKMIDVLVNNAGITADGLFLMMPPDDWQRVIDTALKGFYNMTKPALQGMVRKKKGSIVTISSVAGIMGNRGQANYSAAKAGLIGASRALSAEVARLGIRVNAVAPGLIETDMIAKAPVAEIKKMIPMARIGKPQEVARVVRFLCSEDASYITGQVISVNGGMA